MVTEKTLKIRIKKPYLSKEYFGQQAARISPKLGVPF